MEVLDKLSDGGFCGTCGKPVFAEAEICPNCGSRLKDPPKRTTKTRRTAILMCLFLGSFGGHRFYLGQTGMGILYLCTLGLLGIGLWSDLIRFIMMSDEEFLELYGN